MTVTLTQHDRRRLVHTAEEFRRAREGVDSWARHREEAIRMAARNGASVREIAEVAGVSHQRVHQIIGGKA